MSEILPSPVAESFVVGGRVFSKAYQTFLFFTAWFQRDIQSIVT